jgi:hypothetical protein
MTSITAGSDTFTAAVIAIVTETTKGRSITRNNSITKSGLRPDADDPVGGNGQLRLATKGRWGGNSSSGDSSGSSSSGWRERVVAITRGAAGEGRRLRIPPHADTSCYVKNGMVQRCTCKASALVRRGKVAKAHNTQRSRLIAGFGLLIKKNKVL